MNESRTYQIERLAGEGSTKKLLEVLSETYTQEEMDMALCNALAYSRIETCEQLISMGADISWGNHNGVYYAVHNDEIDGLMYSISKGVDLNTENGMILNTAVMTATNTKNNSMVKWILESGGDPKLLSQDSLNTVEKFGNEELKTIIRRFLDHQG
ncbi:hypothetical protein KFE98_03270 [bacterium SCSIO 12741]|nr:hypothetical protein KFE98_03270 [bacterium SCSIO 12741]